MNSPLVTTPPPEASKQAANPLADAWLMQIQQNNNWIGMPATNGHRVQSNLQFQPLISGKPTDDWNLIARPAPSGTTCIGIPSFLANLKARLGPFPSDVISMAAAPLKISFHSLPAITFAAILFKSLVLVRQAQEFLGSSAGNRH
jgi:hypothetical protein